MCEQERGDDVGGGSGERTPKMGRVSIENDERLSI